MRISNKIFTFCCLAAIAVSSLAQVESSGVVRRRSERDRKKNKETEGVAITDRMQGFYEAKPAHDADLDYMRVIYRQLDLSKPANTPLYYPEDIVDGQENLFRLILKQVVDGRIPAYEYLDGREVFSDKYRIKVGDMLDRFDIYYQKGKGSTEKNPKYVIEEADVPSGQVQKYYIIEKWEFDRRSNRMKTRVEAICPVLTRTGDFGGETPFPMFWVKFDALRPWLSQQYIFLNDDNNLPRYSLDDYFNLGMYEGDIYKTQNLRNLSMVQMFPDEDALKHAQDSIDRRLREFGKDLWVPTREEYLAQKEAEAEKAAKLAAGDSIPDRTVASETETSVAPKANIRRSARATKKRARPKVKKAPAPKNNQGNSNATKSVRRRKR